MSLVHELEGVLEVLSFIVSDVPAPALKVLLGGSLLKEDVPCAPCFSNCFCGICLSALDSFLLGRRTPGRFILVFVGFASCGEYSPATNQKFCMYFEVWPVRF